MLTKDLVRYKTSGDTITPQFINPDDTALLEVAKQLTDVFEDSQGKTRAQLLEESKYVIESSPSEAVISRGLEKLLLDRTEFNTDLDEELVELRRDLFKQTSQLLSTELFPNFDAYQTRVQTEFKSSPAELGDKLYADLPDD